MSNNHVQISSTFLVWVVCISTITVFAEPHQPKDEKAVRVSGHILDRASRQPIEAARITLIPSKYECVWRTDSDGRFSFWVPIESNQRINIEHDGYQSVSLHVRHGDLHDIRMSPVSNLVTVTASDAPHLMFPSQAVVPAILTADSGPKMSGAGSTWSRWYRLGAGKAPGGYTLERVDFWLSGDRACGAGAECREISKNDDQILWEFRLQGHEERGAPPRTYSVAHIRVLYVPQQ